MEEETLNSLILSRSMNELDRYFKYVAVDSNVAEKILHATWDQSNSLWHAQRKVKVECTLIGTTC